MHFIYMFSCEMYMLKFCMSLTKQDKQDVQEIADNAVSDLTDIIGAFANNVDNRFEQVDKRFENLEGRMENIEDEWVV